MIFKDNEIILEKHSDTINKSDYNEMTVEEFINSENFTLNEKNEFLKELAINTLAVNIHFMLAQETYERAFEIVEDIASDPRLAKMNAIVFLQLKKKGRGKEGDFNYIGSVEKYKKLIEFCKEKGVNYGFDSCSAPLYFKSTEGTEEYEMATVIGEPCESSCFSSYINCYGEFFPCSFAEGEGEWKEGINVIKAENFNKVWFHKKVTAFRKTLINSSKGCINCASQKYCRSCPIYEGVAGCKTT